MRVSSRCMALRAVCPIEAMTVKTAQSQPAAIIRILRPLGRGSGALLGREHVIHVHVVGAAPLVAEKVVHDSAFLDDREATRFERGFELAGGDEFLPTMGTDRK